MSGKKTKSGRKKEFIIFEKKKRKPNSTPKYRWGTWEQKVRNQRRNINEKLIKIETEQKQKLAERRAKKRKIKEEKGKLDNLAKMTENRLFSAKTVWPFDLFRNRVYIEEKQVILVFKEFFFVTQEYHILIEDILVPVVENSILFSTLKIQLGPGGFQQDPPPVKYLPKKDALKAKEIIMGLLVCLKDKIDLEDMEKEELIEKLVEIGRYKKE